MRKLPGSRIHLRQLVGQSAAARRVPPVDRALPLEPLVRRPAADEPIRRIRDCPEQRVAEVRVAFDDLADWLVMLAPGPPA